MTPDEFRYWTAAGGARVARPFHYRWMLPRVLGQNHAAWVWCQRVALVASAGLLWAYTGEWWACLLILGCAGLCKFNLRHPALVDLPAFALALGAAVTWREGWWPIALGLVFLSGMVKETGPVFAACFAWHPALLGGLLAPLIRCAIPTGPDPVPSGPASEALEHPFAQSWAHHKPLPLWVWVLPWGVLLAAVANPSPQLWVTLALAYGQCLVATDTVRLYQWSAPVLALCAVPMLTGPWLPMLLVLHLTSPFRTEGL